jgi:hypothetical protein
MKTLVSTAVMQFLSREARCIGRQRVLPDVLDEFP